MEAIVELLVGDDVPTEVALVVGSFATEGFDELQPANRRVATAHRMTTRLVRVNLFAVHAVFITNPTHSGRATLCPHIPTFFVRWRSKRPSLSASIGSCV